MLSFGRPSGCAGAMPELEPIALPIHLEPEAPPCLGPAWMLQHFRAFRGRVWCAEASTPPSGLAEVLATYDDEGYTSMNLDTNRNKAYQLAVSAAVKVAKCLRWLEVGCGSSATLTRMVLSIPGAACSIACIEGNVKSAADAERVLQSLYPGARWRVVPGMSADPAVLHAALKPMSKPCQAVLHEVFGFLASSEGIAHIVADIQDKFASEEVQALPLFVPCLAASFYAPTSLSLTHVKRNGDIYVSSNFLLVTKFPIRQACLTDVVLGMDRCPPCGCIEYLDFRNPAREQMQQERTGSFRVNRTADFNSLTTFVWAGFASLSRSKRGGPMTNFPYGVDELGSEAAELCSSFSSASFDADGSASNWRNLIVLLPESVPVEAGDTITVVATTDMRALNPTYTFRIEVTATDGGSKACVTVVLDDLYPNFARHDGVVGIASSDSALCAGAERV